MVFRDRQASSASSAWLTGNSVGPFCAGRALSSLRIVPASRAVGSCTAKRAVMPARFNGEDYRGINVLMLWAIYTVELYRKARMACADGMSKRAAAAHFNISRDTVEKALAFSVPPGYRRTAPIKWPKLDGFTEIIDAWLDGDKTVHRKQRHTAKRIFDRLRDEHGFTGGYTIIKDYVRERQRRGQDPSLEM